VPRCARCGAKMAPTPRGSTRAPGAFPAARRVRPLGRCSKRTPLAPRAGFSTGREGLNRPGNTLSTGSSQAAVEKPGTAVQSQMFRIDELKNGPAHYARVRPPRSGGGPDFLRVPTRNGQSELAGGRLLGPEGHSYSAPRAVATASHHLLCSVAPLPGPARMARPVPAETPSARAASRGRRRSEHPRHGAIPPVIRA